MAGLEIFMEIYTYSDSHFRGATFTKRGNVNRLPRAMVSRTSPPVCSSLDCLPLQDQHEGRHVRVGLEKSRRDKYRVQAQAENADFPRQAERKKNRACLTAERSDELEVQELSRPLSEYMALPASQYSVLDAERIERIDDNTFKCYTHRLKFFSFEVCPVLAVRVEELPGGCCIRLLSCTLEGSPVVVAQNNKFSASMANNVSWRYSSKSSTHLLSDTVIEVTLDIPPAFRFLPVASIEATGNQVLSQLLRLMLPRFLQQLASDYKAWASGDKSRKPHGTGQL